MDTAAPDNEHIRPSRPIPAMAHATTMSSRFDDCLTRLGLAEYHEVLVSHGFESWDDLLDINEEDMEGLGFKRGHRRKLQREIASSRGQPHSEALLHPLPMDDMSEGEQPGLPVANQDAVETVEPAPSKRKYRRRQPKDPLAPRLPNSDYVLFGNFLRQDPNVSKLSFVDISRRVGEKWQALSQAERTRWTTAAAEQKSKYNTELAQYQQTGAHQKYQNLLHTQDRYQGIIGVGSNRKAIPENTHPTLSRHRRRTLGSSSTESSMDHSKDSSITMVADEDGGRPASFDNRFKLPSFESSSSSSAMEIFEQRQILYRSQSYIDRSQNTSSLYDPPPLQSSMVKSNQTANSPQHHAKLARPSLNPPVTGLDFSRRDSDSNSAARSSSFHIQVLNPFRMVPGPTIWPLLEGYLQHVNSSHYYVNAEHLVNQFNLAVNEVAAVALPNYSMCTLCLCISLGCQVHASGSDEMAIMWYENGRRYLDSDDWGWSLHVMRALALISLFHQKERPTTARHYLDIAMRIGEANNLFAHVNGESSIDNAPGHEWILVGTTMQRMASVVGLG